MHVALLALALTASPAWGRFNLFANGGVNQLDSRSGSSYGAGASQVFYGGGLVDDGMPLAYQPLEQQLPSLVLSGFYERTMADSYEGNELGGSVSGTAYVDKSVGFSAGLSLEALHDAVGLRTADFMKPDLSLAIGGATPRDRFWLGVDLEQLYVNGTGWPAPEAFLSASGGTLIANRLWVGIGVGTGRAGEHADVDLELAPTHATHFELSGYAQRGQIYINSLHTFARVGGDASAAIWLRDELRLGLTYGLSSAEQDLGNGQYGDPEVVQSVSLAFGLRLQ